MRTHLFYLITYTIALTWLTDLSAQATFEGIGFLSESNKQSRAFDVSDDGNVIVGWSVSELDGNFVAEAFRWEEGVMQGLGDLPGGVFSSQARGVSGDGSVVIGYGVTSAPIVWEAFRWDATDGMVGLGDFVENDIYSEATDVSYDGSVIVGRSYTTNKPMLWINGELQYLEEELFGEAWGVSADGSMVVGSGDLNDVQQAFIWTQETGAVGLGAPAGGYSIASKISADGNTVVGIQYSSDFEAFRWTGETGMEGLGFLSGGNYSNAKDVSDDGKTVVGVGNSADEYIAFIWREETGMQNLKEVLETEYGLDLTGWVLSNATAISADGTIIVGEGINPDGHPEGWRAVLPPHSSGGCMAPYMFFLDETSDTSVMFSWDPSPSEVNGYNWLIMYTGQVPGVEEPVASGTTQPGMNSAFAMGLTPGTSYQVYLQTKCNGDEESNYGGPFMITTTGGGGGECEAPGSFFLEEVTESSVWFSWDPSPSEVNGYNWLIMYIGQVPGVEEPVTSGTTQPGMNSAFAMGLTPGTSYQVYLQTKCEGDEISNYSGPFMITTTGGGGGECEAPGSFFLEEVTESTASFSWNPSPSEVSGYNWFVMNLGESPDMNDPVAGGTTLSWMTWATATDLTPDTMYHVFLQTSCDGGEQSDYAGPFMITTTGGGGECTQPSDITISTVTDAVVFVSWTENGDATQWEIEYGESGFIQGEGTIIFDNDGSPNETIGGLTQGMEYDVYVRAVCSSSESEWEGPVSFVIEPEPCSPPTNVVVDVITPSMVYITWTENGGATQWEIEYGETDFTQGTGTTITDNDGMPGEAISGLEEGMDYDVYVRAICEFSGSDWEGPVTFNTEAMGINELENQMILYPNPTTGIIHLQTQKPIKAVSVYNLVGQKVSFKSLNQENTSIDISNLSSGIYFVEVILNNNKKIKTYKVIKN